MEKRTEREYLLYYASECNPVASLSDFITLASRIDHRMSCPGILREETRERHCGGTKTKLYLLLRHHIRAQRGLLGPLGNLYYSIQRSL